MSILVKSFGYNADCKDIDELKEVLMEQYTNTSIAIVANKQTYYVDVMSDGSLLNSYGSNAVSFDIFLPPPAEKTTAQCG